MFFYKNNKSNNLFIYFLIVYPLVIFIFNNLDQLFHLSKLFYIGSFFLIFPIIFVCFIFLNSKKTDLIKYKLPLLLSLIWFLQFYFLDIRSFFTTFNDKIDGYIALVIILLLSLIITFLLKYKYLKKFFLLFLVINLFLSFILNFNFFFETNQKSLPNKYYKQISIDYDSKNPNVYYIILDGLTSSNFLEEKFNFKINSFKNKLEKKGFKIAENARSSYNLSHLTLGSIFYADYFLDENSKKYYDRSYFYPSIFNFKQHPPLLKYLNKKNYKFVLFSSSWGKCKKNYRLNCIFPDGSIVSRTLNDYAFFTFIFKSMIPSIAVKLNIKFLDQNDTVKVLQKKIEKDYSIWEKGSVFTFVHAVMPHEPYRYENCIINDNAKISGYKYALKDEMEYYISSVKCTMLRIEEVTETILSKDKDALIIFQSDHGTSMFKKILEKEDIIEESVNERLSIFNAALLPKKCRNKFNSRIGNVGTIQLVLSCIGINISNMNLNEPRSFIGFYEESKSFGKVFEIK